MFILVSKKSRTAKVRNLFIKNKQIGLLMAFSLADTQKSGIFANGIGIWCNGSTTDFGSVCSGSNPDIPTKAMRRPFGRLLKCIKVTESPLSK